MRVDADGMGFEGGTHVRMNQCPDGQETIDSNSITRNRERQENQDTKAGRTHSLIE